MKLILRVAVTSFLLASMPLQTFAASSTTSLVSDSVGRSVGSISDSFGTSSKSSNNGGKAAAGDYKLLEVMVADNQTGRVQLKMQAAVDGTGEGAGELILSLPTVAFENSGLAVGDVISAKDKSYGMEFINGKTQKSFFLVLSDATFRELASTQVN